MSTGRTSPRSKCCGWKRSLRHARNETAKVIIGSHIPPTFTEGQDDWQPEFMEQFQGLIEQYADTVLLQVYGHHSTEMIRGYTPNFALSVASGFSPRTATVPTYQYIRHNFTASGQTNAVVKEIGTYYLDLTAAAANPEATQRWNLLYNMASTYGVPDVSQGSLYNIASKIVMDQATANKYFNLQMRSPKEVLDMPPTERNKMLCETAVSTPLAQEECVGKLEAASGLPVITPGSDNPALGYIVGAVLLTIALLTIAGGVFFLLIRKRAELELRAREQMLIGDRAVSEDS